jgi:hypothetical protein
MAAQEAASRQEASLQAKRAMLERAQWWHSHRETCYLPEQLSTGPMGLEGQVGVDWRSRIVKQLTRIAGIYGIQCVRLSWSSYAEMTEFQCRPRTMMLCIRRCLPTDLEPERCDRGMAEFTSVSP